MNVFLSYSSSEHELAERLAYSLRDEDYTVFFDRTSLTPGDGYHSHIRSAIDTCDLFIFLISQESVMQGSYALTELGFAKQKWDSPSSRILPVMVHEVDINTLPTYLNAVTILRPQGNLVAEVLATVNQLIPSESVEPVQVMSSLSNAGWKFHFEIRDYKPIKEMFYKFADEAAFVSTGFTRYRDQRTGLFQPRLSMEVPLFTGTRTLLTKYIDLTGRENGPYRHILDAVKLIVAETKDLLEITMSSWVGFQEYPKGRMFLYFTHLLVYRNSLKQIQYSVDTESLSKRVKYTPDWSGPGSPGLGDDDEVYIEIPMSAKFVDVKLVFIDGSEWPARRFAVTAPL